ncbi:MAG: hypothetical protein LBN08_03695 [Lactobacillales bacterium]|jgi:hypothetical protein|nr:hypothetical protein [Lactobacillales bacterium]
MKNLKDFKINFLNDDIKSFQKAPANLVVGTSDVTWSFNSAKEGIPFEHETVTNITKKAEVHGLECVETSEVYVNTFSGVTSVFKTYQRHMDGYDQCLALSEEYDESVQILTFKDEPFGDHQENGGISELDFKKKNIIKRIGEEDFVMDEEVNGTVDLVGQYEVSFNGKSYVCYRTIFTSYDFQVSDFLYLEDGTELLRRFFIYDKHGYDNPKGAPYSEWFERVDYLTLNGEKRINTDILINKNAL